MWMIEHPCAEDEHEEPHGEDGGGSGVGGRGSDCPGATASSGGKSLDRSPYLCSSPGDIADASEMEEGFSER